MQSKRSSKKWRPFCSNLNMIINQSQIKSGQTRIVSIDNVLWHVNALSPKQTCRRFVDIFNCNCLHWGRVTQICVSKFTIIGSDNGLSPIRPQAIIWTNAGILLIRTLGTNFSEILIQIQTFSNKKMHWKMSSGKCRPFCLGLSVLRKGLNF